MNDIEIQVHVNIIDKSDYSNKVKIMLSSCIPENSTVDTKRGIYYALLTALTGIEVDYINEEVVPL